MASLTIGPRFEVFVSLLFLVTSKLKQPGRRQCVAVLVSRKPVPHAGRLKSKTM
jgi:hypothetical protein